MKKLILMGFFAAGALLSLANCSSGGGGSSNSTGVNAYGQCTTAGQVYISQAGTCVAQGSCPVGYGFYNNTCVVGTSNYGGNSSCGVGSVYSSQYGCLAQGSCPAGMGSINNTCVQGTSTNMPYQGYGQPGGMIGQSGMIGGGFNPYNNAYAQNQCGIGAVMTSRGCLPQYAGCVDGGGYAYGRCWF